MNDASNLLKERSQSYLLDLTLQIEHDLTREDASPAERASTLELGTAQFTQINALLKATLDAADLPSFTEVERTWAKMFDDLYFTELESDSSAIEAKVLPGETPWEVRRLARYRQVLRLGLAMWAAHLYGRWEHEPAEETPLEAMRILSQRFESIDALFDVFERASEREDNDERLPWTEWFLGELPTGEAHFIPTRSELLFTTVLLAVILAPAQAPTVRPRHWLTWQYEEVTAALERLDSEAPRWGRLIPEGELDTGLQASTHAPLESWHKRVATVSEMFAAAKSDTEAEESEKLRHASLDGKRVADFRVHLLAKTRESRLIRDIFALHGVVERLDASPEGHVALVSRSWMPKSYFTPDSRVVGLEMTAGDLARVTQNAEINQLLEAIDDEAPRPCVGTLSDTVVQAIKDLRDGQRRPSLIVIPIGWELHRALGLDGWRNKGGSHPLIPLNRRRDFEGIFHDVPVIDFPHVRKDRLWVVDLAAAACYREWPSDEESGIEFELKAFDVEAATAMLTEHPEVRAEGFDDRQAMDQLRERVLVSLRLCWEVRSHDPGASISIAIPAEFQR
jgi:hypothetical protein